MASLQQPEGAILGVDQTNYGEQARRVTPRSETTGRERAVTQLQEVDGPHHLPQGEQERCAVEGRRIDGSGVCTVIAIRDRQRRGWVLYPHGVAGLGVLIADGDAHILGTHIGGPA
ncbi:MAG: hypothetical protein ACRDS0_28015 [Pseudonocardiaceae bacterium]